MPLVAYPSVNAGRHPDEAADTILTLPVERTELVLATPSRHVHENEATRDVMVVNRGPAFWTLTLTIGSVEVETALHREFEQWLARMHDLRNYANIPIGTRAFDGELNYVSGIDARSVTSVSGNTLTLDHPLYWGGTPDAQGRPVGGTSPLPVGSYIRVNNQLAMVEAIDDSGRDITTAPILGAVGDFVALAKTMRCRLAGAGQYNLTTSDGLTDPISVPFVEHR